MRFVFLATSSFTLAKKRLLPLSTKNLGRQSLSQALSFRNQPKWSGLLQSYRTPVFWSWKGGRAMVVAMVLREH